jgi:hypothetical protein
MFFFAKPWVHIVFKKYLRLMIKEIMRYQAQHLRVRQISLENKNILKLDSQARFRLDREYSLISTLFNRG